MPPERPPVDFAAALKRLSDAGVEFVIVGGFAATLEALLEETLRGGDA